MADAKKGQRCRFSGEEELILLREVIALNPFENRSKWAAVQERVVSICAKNFSVRLVKEHTENLAKLWQKQDGLSLRKSETEEQYMEKDRLLQEVRDLMEEFGAKKKSKISTMQAEEEVDWESVKVIEEVTTTPSSSVPNSSPTKTPTPIQTQIVTPTSTHTPTPIPNPTMTMTTTRTPNPTLTMKPTHTLILTRTPNPTLFVAPKRATIPTSTPSESPTATPTSASSLTPTPTPTGTQVVLNSVRPRELTVKGSTLLNLKDSTWHREVEEKKLVMEERRLKLQEEKFSMEKKEREAKLAMELKERERKLEMEIQEREARLRLEAALMQNATTLTGILAEILKQLKK